MMYISLYSKNNSHPELKTSRDRRISFSTYVDLRTCTSKLTISELFQALISDLHYNPPRGLRGNRYQIEVRQVRYWAQFGPYCSTCIIQLPLKNPNKRFPPMAKLKGSYRILFCTIHSFICETYPAMEEYPKNPHARLRHIGESNLPGKTNFRILKERYENSQIYKLPTK